MAKTDVDTVYFFRCLPAGGHDKRAEAEGIVDQGGNIGGSNGVESEGIKLNEKWYNCQEAD